MTIYEEKVKLCYIDTYRFTEYITIDDVYKDIAEDFETRLNTSNYELDIPLTKGENKKVIGVMKNGLVREIIKEFLGLREKT